MLQLALSVVDVVISSGLACRKVAISATAVLCNFQYCLNISPVLFWVMHVNRQYNITNILTRSWKYSKI